MSVLGFTSTFSLLAKHPSPVVIPGIVQLYIKVSGVASVLGKLQPRKIDATV